MVNGWGHMKRRRGSYILGGKQWWRELRSFKVVHVRGFARLTIAIDQEKEEDTGSHAHSVAAQSSSYSCSVGEQFVHSEEEDSI